MHRMIIAICAQKISEPIFLKLSVSKINVLQTKSELEQVIVILVHHIKLLQAILCRVKRSNVKGIIKSFY